MIALLVKDVRQSLAPLVFSVVLLVSPLLIYLAVQYISGMKPDFLRDCRAEIAAMIALGSVASVLAAAAFGGVAFAKERRERTAELLATAPVERWRVVASKLAVCVVLSSAPALVGVVAALLVGSNEGLNEVGRMRMGDVLGAASIVAAWLFLLGLSWCFSSLLRSEVLAASAAILAAFGAGTLLVVLMQRRVGVPPVDEITLMSAAIAIFGVPGALGLISGTWIALVRRSA